jgi:hypothetical protein
MVNIRIHTKNESLAITQDVPLWEINVLNVESELLLPSTVHETN